MQTIYKFFNKFKAFSVWIFLILFFLGFNTVQAQQSGRITGTVSDQNTGEPLPFAHVMIEGTTLGTTTTSEGEYIIRQVQPGEYNLIVGFIGYQRQEIPITLTSGETLEVNISLESVAVEGEEVQITAQALGQRQAINEQLSSNTITNVVSAARIQDIPDINAAESVGRLSGVSVVRSGGEGQKVTIRGMSPQFNVIMVNGIRMQSTDRDNRSVDLNMIAPNVLSGISVTKALTADMDADAVGGTVNLRIGKAKEGFHGNFSVQGGYASMANTREQRYGNYRLSGHLSNRFFNDNLGVQLSGFLDDHNRNSDVLGAGYGVPDDEGDEVEEGSRRVTLSNTTINHRVTDRQRVGGSLVLDYDFSNGSLILNNFISSLNEDAITQNNNFTTGLGWRGWVTDNEFTNTVINNALQGEFEFGNIQMDFSLSNSVSKQRNPNNLSMDIRTLQGGAIGLTELDGCSNLNQMSPTNFLNCVEVIPRDKIATGTSSLIRDVDAAAQAAALNFELPFNFTDYLSGNLKLGGKYERNTRDNDEELLYINMDRGGLAGDFITLLKNTWPELGLQPEDTHVGHRLVRDPDYEVESFLSGNEGINGERFYNLISIDKMKRLEQIARDNGYYLSAPLESNVYDYNYTRNFHAFYVSSEINIGKYITLQPGIRYEAFAFDYTADSTIVTGRLTTPGEDYFNSETIQSDVTKGENWFPQLQMRIKPTDWFDVRLARTKSIIYPDYRAISPYIYMDLYATPYLNLGNPSLKPSTTVNYDIYASVYENHIGLFTAGVFYKEIEDFIVPVSYFTNDASKINNRVSLPTNQRTNIDTWTNLDKTSHVKGIELEWQTHFWYLPWIFDGLVFNINYTHMQSETHYTRSYDRRTGTPPFIQTVRVDTTRSDRLLNQPDDILNLTAGYDIGGFSARLSYQYTDNIIRGVATTYTEVNSYTSAYKRWDFSARQKFPWLEGLEAYLNVNNITNRPDRAYNGRGKLTNVEYYGRTAALGVRYSF